MESEFVEAASTSYKDWVGSAAAENSVINTSLDLYELSGLDHDEWTILAIDMFTFSHGRPSDWTVRVYALNRREAGVSGFDEMMALQAVDDGVPVTEVLLHGVSIEDIVRCMKVLAIQLINPNTPKLRITGRADYPVQPE